MPTQIFTASTTWTVPANVFRIAEVFILGGGGGGGGGGAAGGGGGGGGGRILRQPEVAVTPGSLISVVVGLGGAGGSVGIVGSSGGSSFFGALSALGGGGGSANNGSGGTSGRVDNVVSPAVNATYTSIAGPNGGGGAGAGGSATTPNKNGANGFFYTYLNDLGLSTTNYFGPGGGAGCITFTSATPRPLLPGVGGIEGGGMGGSEDNPAISGVENPAMVGQENRGAGGGGGAASGTSTVLIQTTGSPTFTNTFVAAPATPGAAGGSGIVIIRYNTAQFRLRTNVPGINEGGVITVTLETNEVVAGTVVPFSITGTGITASDFSAGLTAGTLNGNFTVVSTGSVPGEKGQATVNLTIATDALTDSGNIEIATLTLNNGLASVSFYIGDSSLTPGSISVTKIIETKDYNNIRNKLVPIIGPSSLSTPDYGWGQTIISTAITGDNYVTVNEWANLRYDILNAWGKIFDSVPSLASPTVGQTVRASLTTEPYAQYDTFANAISAARMTISANRAVTRTKDFKDYAAEWGTSLQALVQVTFTSAQKAREFFNTGAEVRFLSQMTVGISTNPKTESWVNHLSAIGTQGFGGGKPDTLLDPNTGVNYYRLTSSFLPWYSSATSGSYSGNIYRISARSVGVVDNSQGEASQIEFQVEWIDSSVPITSTDGSINTTDTILGTTVLTVSTFEPTGVLQPPGAGNFVVETPTVTIVSIGP